MSHVGFGRVNNETEGVKKTKKGHMVGSNFSAEPASVTESVRKFMSVRILMTKDQTDAQTARISPGLRLPRPQLHRLKKLRVLPQVMVGLYT